ncbi:MAG TPA: hypothetical protein VEL28_19520 [Candidatus Binatia bacterium]|nr:hypothetical protein [Candidatus Binatia bacterium]
MITTTTAIRAGASSLAARLEAAAARRSGAAAQGATFLDRLRAAAAPTPLGPIVFSLSMGCLCCR